MNGDSTTAVPDGLPACLTLAQLQWLTGLTKARIGQLVVSGVIRKLGRDSYSIESIPRYCATQREGTGGSSRWNEARTRLASERAAMAKLSRLELEGKLVPLVEMIEANCRAVAVVRDRLLGLGAKLATRLAIASKPAECQQIVYEAVYETLLELSVLTVAPRKPTEEVRRNGQTA
jgi:hypothetical protein